MLNSSQLSDIKMLDENCNVREEWFSQRIGKITSSQVYKLCAPKGFGDLAWGYIRTRAYERISRVSTDKEVNTQATINGLVEEGNSLRVFMRKYEIPTGFFRVQRLINGLNQFESSTPDAIWIKNVFDVEEISHYEVETVESKSFEALKHMECIEAERAEDVKDIDPKTYWQKIDQLVVSGALSGKLIYFNSQLPENSGGYKEIAFRQVELIKDVRHLKQRKNDAQEEIQKIVNRLTKK
jgi:hypothetical protein